MNVEISSINVNSRKRELNPNKVKELAGSIQTIGLLNPITIDEDNRLIAGLHRLEACRLLGWETIPATVTTLNDPLDKELAEIDENLRRNDLTVLEQAEHLQRRDEILEAKGMRARLGENQFTRQDGSDTVSLPLFPDNNKDTSVSPPTVTTAEIASEVGLSERSAQRRIQIARDIAPEVKAAIRDTEIADSTTQLLKLARMNSTKQKQVAQKVTAGEATNVKEAVERIRRDELVQQQEAIAKGEVALPEGVFEIIVVDPPWPYGTKYDSEGRRAANPYPEMRLEQIGAINLPSAADCILWLWTTHKFMRHSFQILDGWGFRDVSIITWEKDQIGLGQWLRSNSEFCIMAVKGKPQVNLTNQRTVIHGPMREHSRKPDEFYLMIDQLCIGRKLDYFARQQRPGWAVAGSETDKFNGGNDDSF